MARQARTRQPKEKFAERKRLTCVRCAKSTSSFDIVMISGKPSIVCKVSYGDCRRPSAV